MTFWQLRGANSDVQSDERLASDFSYRKGDLTVLSTSCWPGRELVLISEKVFAVLTHAMLDISAKLSTIVPKQM